MKHVDKVVLICSGLYTPGGIERASVNLANLFSSNGIDVTLLILDKTPESFYEINSGVKIVHDNLHFGITKTGNVVTRKLQFVGHIRKLGRILNTLQPNIVISTEYAFTIAAYLVYRRKARLISWEHHHFYWIKKNKFWQTLFNAIYPKVNTVVCLNKTESILFNTIGCRTVVIPNFVTNQEQISNIEEKNLLTVGWLIKRKGVDMIPEIAEKVKEKHPDWRWKIIGDGPFSSLLQQEISKRKINDFLEILPPHSSDLSLVYQNTSIYVMTSRFECFPMVLLEALSYGIPCIAFNCPTGPADIIKNYEDGYLIEKENTNAMSEAICALIEQEANRKKMGENARYNVQRFSPDKILNQWEALFMES